MKKLLCLVLTLTLFLTLTAFADSVDPAVKSPVDSPEISDIPPEIEKIIEDHQSIYRLTIYYIYLDGTTAAPTYTEQLEAGVSYSVPSPEITGYTPTMYIVSGVMPARDVEYTVIYIPRSNREKPFFTLEDYETPLGFGASMMNVGICIE